MTRGREGALEGIAPSMPWRPLREMTLWETPILKAESKIHRSCGVVRYNATTSPVSYSCIQRNTANVFSWSAIPSRVATSRIPIVSPYESPRIAHHHPSARAEDEISGCLAPRQRISLQEGLDPDN